MSESVAITAPVAILAGPSSGNGRLLVTAWLLAFTGIVVLASAGRLAAGPSEARTAVAPSTSLSATAFETTPALVVLPEMIVVLNPAVANTVVTTRELEVRGYLREGGGTIRITLEARGNRMIDEATITLTPAAGEPPNIGRRARFETRFGLPNPRPNGRMILQVALLDDEGRILDVIRRPFRVGPLRGGPGD